MPFENESLLKAYVEKINSSKKGADILFKKTIDLLQSDKVVPTNSTLKNVDETIRVRLSIITKADLFKVLSNINEQTLRNYFIKLEELFKQNVVDNEVIINFINEILGLASDKQLEAVGRLPSALFVLAKKLLAQLPSSSRQAATSESVYITDAVTRLAKCVYTIEPTCYKDFSDKLIMAVHANEINNFQLFQFIEKLLDEEFRTKHKENNYMRSNNIITNMIVAILPPEDRARFLLLISVPLLNFMNAISLFKLKRAAHSQPKFNMDKERSKLINAKPPHRDQSQRDQFSSQLMSDELWELVDSVAKSFHDLIIVLEKITVESLPPYFNASCQLIAQNLIKNLPNNQDNTKIIAFQVCSFITNKLFASICLEWIKKTYPKENEYITLFSFILLKPLQNLATSFRFERFQVGNNREAEAQLPEAIMRSINQENHFKLLNFSNRIINEKPSSLQKLCLTQQDCQAVLAALPHVAIPAGPPPKQVLQSNVLSSMNGGHSKASHVDDDSDSSGCDSEEEEKKQIERAQPKTAARIASMAEILDGRGSPSKSAVPLHQNGTAANHQESLPIIELIRFDKLLDEEDVELRLMIIFEECLALTKKLNVFDNLPSQSSFLPKVVVGFFQQPPSLKLPSKSDVSKDLVHLSQRLLQNNSEDKNRLLDLYKALDAAVCSFEAYKTYNVAVTKAGLEDPVKPPPPNVLVSVPLK